MSTVRLSSKGQLVLPKTIREQLGLKAGQELKIELVGGKIILEPYDKEMDNDWRRWRGALKGEKALEEHLKEHRLEVIKDGQSV